MTQRSTQLSFVILVLFSAGLLYAVDPPPGLRIFQEAPEIPDGGLPIGSSVSRTVGVAPLSVHFFADFAMQSDRTNRFRNYDYTWDFDDPTSGKWATTGKPKNLAKGAAAAHVFEEPGTYNVTLQISDHNGVVGTESYTITVVDPDIFYEGDKTTCVTDGGSNDFSGCPSGARRIATDDLSSVVQYAQAGHRVLFHRGSAWTTGSLNWPAHEGPVTIGAYGERDNPPRITVSGDFLQMSGRQDWRVMDLDLEGDGSGNSFGGVHTGVVKNWLLLRVRSEGFSTALQLYRHEAPLAKYIAVVDSELASVSTTVFINVEYSALLGNTIRDSDDSHNIRFRDGWKTVIGHNAVYGASDWGHALTLRRGDFFIISDNIFGSSGEWPVSIRASSGDASQINDGVVERNRFIADYGTIHTVVQRHLVIMAQNITVRNNVFDGTGGHSNYHGIAIFSQAGEPDAFGTEIYNNSIYYDISHLTGDNFYLVSISSSITDTTVRNNLASFPDGEGGVRGGVISDSSASGETTESNNLLIADPGFYDPDNGDPLSRDFRIDTNVAGATSVIDQGTDVPVYDDFDGDARQPGDYDLGAFAITEH